MLQDQLLFERVICHYGIWYSSYGRVTIYNRTWRQLVDGSLMYVSKKWKKMKYVWVHFMLGDVRRRAYRLGMSGGRSHQHAQNPFGRVKETLNNPPWPIIHLVNGLHCFYGITMSLKWPLVPKSDANQQFTTTMCVKKCICLYLETKLNQHRVLYNCTCT